MMSSLNWKYVYRGNVWLKWLPVYLLLFELVTPLKLVLVPFLLMKNLFFEFNSMTPLNLKTIQMTKCTLVESLIQNNVIVGITGLLIHVFVRGVFVLYFQLLGKEYDATMLYDFIPLLIASITIGNLFVYLQFNGRPQPGIIQYITFAFFLLLVQFFIHISFAMYAVVTALTTAALFISYKLAGTND